MRQRKGNSVGDRILMILVGLFLYAPIIILIVFSFNAGNSSSVWKGFSLHWYAELLQTNLIPNTRDRGVNEMSAALKRRFDFETVFPIMDFAQELELVASASARLLAHSGIPHKVPDAVLELLVRTFRDLRANGEKKTSMDTLTAIMSTAEAVNVAHAVGVRAWFLANRAGEPADLVDCIAGTIVKDNEEDRARLRRYFEQRVATHKEAHWQAYYQARHRLP